MKPLLPLLPFLVLIVVGVSVIPGLFRLVHPTAALNLDLDALDIEKRLYSIVGELKLDTGSKHPFPRMDSNTSLLRQAQHEFGLQRTNAFIRGGLPVHFWEIRWLDAANGTDEANRIPGQPPSSLRPWRMDTHGNLLAFSAFTLDTAAIAPADEFSAKQAAATFLSTYTPFRITDGGGGGTHSEEPGGAGRNLQLQKIETRRNFNGGLTQYELQLTGREPVLGDSIAVMLKLSGTIPTEFVTEYIVPARFSAERDPILSQIFLSLLHVTIAIITLFLAFQRWRAYELSFRMGLWLGSIAAICFATYMYMVLPLDVGWQRVFPIVFGGLFLGGSVVFIWAVGDSVGREVWPEKFIEIDLLRNGYLHHSRIGSAIIRGMAIGVLSSLVWLVSVYATQDLLSLTIVPSREQLSWIEAYSPLLYISSLIAWISIYNVAAYLVLGLSLVFKRFRQPLIVLPLLALFLVLAYNDVIEPLLAGVIIEWTATMVLIYGYYRYDILTALIAFFVALSASMVLPFFSVGLAANTLSGILFISLPLLLLTYTFITLFTHDRITDFQRIAPTFVKNITERQRLQKELEIARTVQMSFLPRQNPRFYQLDVASKCEPALEVGGDYYDFIELDDHRLGVVIGDVSGKGTQAAFYMTLTKGFLKAVANTSDSPAEVLIQMNQLFYNNVKRGVFITMVYGIFDMRTSQLHLARAGHEPVLMHCFRDQKLETIFSRGIGLGMEMGEIFARTMKEAVVPFQNRDVFVFYTDGFTEAHDRKWSQYGDERLKKIISMNCDKTAVQIMNSIFHDVKNFCAGEDQHDDMTIVVVKINTGAHPDPPVAALDSGPRN